MLAPAKVRTETEPYLACGSQTVCTHWHPRSRCHHHLLAYRWRTCYCWAATVNCDRLLTRNSMGKLLHVGSTGCKEAKLGHSNYNQLIIKENQMSHMVQQRSVPDRSVGVLSTREAKGTRREEQFLLCRSTHTKGGLTPLVG